MSFASLDDATLAGLVPELLLCGHLVDRASMPHVIGAFGREEMGRVAIEAWRGASPVYTRRTLAALGLTGDGVVELFKCLQHDVGAPPQFLDFRFTVHDERHGEFALPHCGALLDVEPLGPEYVETMCHDIEDPTFDATAAAVNPRARIRPLHRPPRVPADRVPHCAWTVTIEPDREELPWPAEAAALSSTRAAGLVLEVPTGGAGRSDYRGSLQPDVDWSTFSRGLLLRLADEISLQWHLLALALGRALARRVDDGAVRDLLRKQLTGIAGVTSGRLRDHLGLPADASSVGAVLGVHPVLAPAGYTGTRVDGDTVVLDRAAPAHDDAGWLPLLLEEDHSPWEALVHGVAPTLGVRVEDTATQRRVHVVDTGVAREDPPEVQLTRFSLGAAFRFEDRHRLPITPV